MSELDAVTRLQDLRDRVWRGEEISPEEYMTVLEDLRQHRRAGGKVAKSKRNGEGSAVTKLSAEEMDQLLKDF